MMGVSEKNVSLKQIFDGILKNQTDIKNRIEARETRIIMEQEEVRSIGNVSENGNRILKEKSEILKQNNNKNDEIVFGLDNIQQNSTAESITREINTLLEIELNPSDLNDFHKLRKNKQKIVL
ncbi:hypothetical protein JTB14_031575 [Gonioctena quinquepunctata]|nr:hypothetical protein JTB14_031575 [Gonioctena quinquepunctata]